MKEYILKNKKWIVVIISILLFIIAVVGYLIFRNPPKNESEIIADLEENKDFFPYCDLTIEELNILRRKTDKKNGTDNIFVEIEAENKDIGLDCTLSYEIKYVLYNDGWELENLSKYNEGVWNISYPEDELILAEVYRQYPFFNANGVEFENINKKFTDETPNHTKTTYSVAFSAKKDMDQFEAIIEGTLFFNLEKNGWQYDETKSYFMDNSNKLIPKYAVGEEAARQIVSQLKDERASEVTLLYADESLENQSASYHFESKTYFKYLTVVDYYAVWYHFDNNTADWVYDTSGIMEEKEEWNIASHIYETEMAAKQFLDNSNRVVRFKIDSFDGKNIEAHYQDPRFDEEKDINGYYSRFDSTSVKSIGDYKYMCIMHGYDTSKFALIIDKDNGLSVKRLPWRGSDDGAYKDPYNDEKNSIYFQMTQVQ